MYNLQTYKRTYVITTNYVICIIPIYISTYVVCTHYSIHTTIIVVCILYFVVPPPHYITQFVTTLVVLYFLCTQYIISTQTSVSHYTNCIIRCRGLGADNMYSQSGMKVWWQSPKKPCGKSLLVTQMVTLLHNGLPTSLPQGLSCLHLFGYLDKIISLIKLIFFGSSVPVVHRCITSVPKK